MVKTLPMAEAEESLEVLGQVVQAVPGGAGLGEAALLEARLVQRKRPLRAGLNELSAAGRDGCCSGFAAGTEGGEGADDVERSGVAAGEGLQEDVGEALAVVVVVHQALRHDKHLPGADLKRDVLRCPVLLRDTGVHDACSLRKPFRELVV